MDRRTFLKSGGLAAATGAATAGSVIAPAPSSAAVPAKGALRLRVVTAWPRGTPVLADPLDQLAATLDAISDGRITLAIAGTATDGIAAIAAERADLYIGSEIHHHQHAPALSLFAEDLRPDGLRPADLEQWITAGAGQLYWDTIAGDLGVKPFALGVAGPRVGLWTGPAFAESQPLWSGRTVAADGMLGHLAAALGADLAPTPAAGEALVAAIASGQIDALFWPSAIAAVLAGLPATGARLRPLGLTAAGPLISVGFARRVWDRLPPSDQSLITAAIDRTWRHTYAGLATLTAETAPLIEQSITAPPPAGTHRKLAQAHAALLDVTATVAASDPTFARVLDARDRQRRTLPGDGDAIA